VERNVKVGGRPHSKIPSIFDHRVRNPSTIESYYQHPLIEPLTKHYALVGTAFDYLLRFAFQYRYAYTVDKPWIAEQATGELYLFLVQTFGKEKADMALQFVEEARKRHAQYLLNGTLTDNLLRSVLLLAQIDPFFRAGMLYEPFGEVDLQDIEDLRRLHAAPGSSMAGQKSERDC
jgi:hypothetical protein